MTKKQMKIFFFRKILLFTTENYIGKQIFIKTINQFWNNKYLTLIELRSIP